MQNAVCQNHASDFLLKSPSDISVLKSKAFYTPSDLSVATHLPEIIRSMKQSWNQERRGPKKRGKEGRKKDPVQIPFEVDNGGLLFPTSVIDKLDSDEGW